jgi:hypothetical protein
MPVRTDPLASPRAFARATRVTRMRRLSRPIFVIVVFFVAFKNFVAVVVKGRHGI